MKTKQPNQGWEKKLRSLYFNWKKSNDFFECVLIPFISQLISQERAKERERILGEVEKGFSEPVANGLRGNFPKTARVVEKEWETLKSNLNKQGKE